MRPLSRELLCRADRDSVKLVGASWPYASERCASLLYTVHFPKLITAPTGWCNFVIVIVASLPPGYAKTCARSAPYSGTAVERTGHVDQAPRRMFAIGAAAETARAPYHLYQC